MPDETSSPWTSSRSSLVLPASNAPQRQCPRVAVAPTNDRSPGHGRCARGPALSARHRGRALAECTCSSTRPWPTSHAAGRLTTGTGWYPTSGAAESVCVEVAGGSHHGLSFTAARLLPTRLRNVRAPPASSPRTASNRTCSEAAQFIRAETWVGVIVEDTPARSRLECPRQMTPYPLRYPPTSSRAFVRFRGGTRADRITSSVAMGRSARPSQGYGDPLSPILRPRASSARWQLARRAVLSLTPRCLYWLDAVARGTSAAANDSLSRFGRSTVFTASPCPAAGPMCRPPTAGRAHLGLRRARLGYAAAAARRPPLRSRYARPPRSSPSGSSSTYYV